MSLKSSKCYQQKLDMHRRLYKNMEEKIPIDSKSFEIAALPAKITELDRILGEYCHGYFQDYRNMQNVETEWEANSRLMLTLQSVARIEATAKSYLALLKHVSQVSGIEDERIQMAIDVSEIPS